MAVSQRACKPCLAALRHSVQPKESIKTAAAAIHDRCCWRERGCGLQGRASTSCTRRGGRELQWRQCSTVRGPQAGWHRRRRQAAAALLCGPALLVRGCLALPACGNVLIYSMFWSLYMQAPQQQHRQPQHRHAAPALAPRRTHSCGFAAAQHRFGRSAGRAGGP